MSHYEYLRIEDAELSKVDYESVLLALMFEQDSRLTYWDGTLSAIIDNMAPDTARVHAYEFHSANFA